jgi:hypothetical protein
MEGGFFFLEGGSLVVVERAGAGWPVCGWYCFERFDALGVLLRLFLCIVAVLLWPASAACVLVAA